MEVGIICLCVYVVVLNMLVLHFLEMCEEGILFHSFLEAVTDITGTPTPRALP